MDMIIGGSLPPLNSSRTVGSAHRRDDNSRGKMQNVRGGIAVDLDFLEPEAFRLPL